ncbi:MAG: Ig-like domain-containing protein, partial [Chitinispirillaceae bacterium]|nr:Ig-like domain-containing protein [Chitinispirillaceae bacterium]
MRKNIKFWIIIGILFPIMLCTIKDDNGNPVNPGRDTQVPVIEEDVIPSLFITPDSLYLFPGDTLGIKVRVFSDTSQKDSIKPLILFPVVAKANKGKIIKDTVLTDSNGRARILFTDTTSGSVELVISGGSVSKTVRFEVTKTPVKVEKLFSISAEKSVIKADGKDSTIISVTVLNTFRNPISSECVQFVTTAGKIKGIKEGDNCGGASGLGITGSDGVARAVLTSSNLNDTAYITAYLVSDQSLSDEIQVAFQGMSIELNASKNNMKRGDTAIITAKVVNASSVPVARVPIYFTREKGNSSNLTILSYDSITNYEGVAVVKVTATGNGSDAIIVSSSGAVARQQINVTSLVVSLELDKTILQTQSGDTSKITVTFVNIEKTPLSGRTVKLTKYFKNEKGGDTTEVVIKNTDSNGKCYFSIPAIGWECQMKVNIMGFDNNEGYVSADTVLQFITTRIMTIRPPQPIPADGVSKGVVTVYIKNKSGNPIVGDIITFTTTAGVITAQSKTDEFGKAEAYLISDRRNITAEVTATLLSDPTKQQKTTVVFKGVEIYATVNPASIRNNGIDSSNVLIRLVDAAGVPIIG